MRIKFGLVERPGSNLLGGETPRLFHCKGHLMKELSIFVDESGDFGPYAKHSPYYIVTMVLHDQSVDISEDIARLDVSLDNLGYSQHTVHTEPLIRKEEDYINLSPNTRRAIFSKLYFFAKNCGIKFKSFSVNKNEFADSFKLEAKIARELSQFIRNHLEFFQSFDNVILYYDNGQHELNRILNTVLATELSQYETRRVLPSEYKLFQVADLICTLTLLENKVETGSLSKSEQLIFHSKRDLKKDFLKGIKSMRLE